MSVLDDKHIIIYLNTNEDGGIESDILAGSRVIPNKPYDHFFYIEDRSSIDIESLTSDYVVRDGQLLKVQE